MQFILAVHSMVCTPMSSVIGDRIGLLLGWHQTLGSFLDRILWLLDRRCVRRFCFVFHACRLGVSRVFGPTAMHALMWFVVSTVDAGSGFEVSPGLGVCYF
jgi:hypothetical protein